MTCTCTCNRNTCNVCTVLHTIMYKARERERREEEGGQRERGEEGGQRETDRQTDRDSIPVDDPHGMNNVRQSLQRHHQF